MSGVPPTPAAPEPVPVPGPTHSTGGHLRAGAIFIVLAILITGVAYPLVVTGIASVLDPGAAGGSLIRYPNGTVEGSVYLAQNLSNGTLGPSLFWERPSLTDWNTTLGAASPPGPTDPALVSLLDEVINYTDQYWNYSANNTSLPLWFVSPSASSVDPDLVVPAVLIQIPRVASANHLFFNNTTLTSFVNAHVVQPLLPDVGVPYVNVLQLDIALLQYTGNPVW